MFRESIDCVLSASKGKQIVLCGAGTYGRELAGILLDNDCDVECFFDNSDSLNGAIIYGIEVRKPYAIKDDQYLFVICVADDYIRYRLRQQLCSIGIVDKQIIYYFPNRCIDYHASLDKKDYKLAIENLYKERFGKGIDWDNPKTYNEILNWEKINYHDERRTLLADKYRAREWVAERIGEEHLTKQYGVWDHTSEMDFDSLPDSFVLKANNGSGRNIIVTDKSKLDIPEACELLEYWMKTNYMYNLFEMHYGDIEPRIIAEEYLEGLAESLYDYDIFCFHGKPQYICCLKGSHRDNSAAAYYDLKWNLQPFSFGWDLDIFPAPKPKLLDKMIELTKILCQDFEHVRVDWYIMPDDRILFSEMTFQTWGGFARFVPSKYDMIFGNLIRG